MSAEVMFIPTDTGRVIKKPALSRPPSRTNISHTHSLETRWAKRWQRISERLVRQRQGD